MPALLRGFEALASLEPLHRNRICRVGKATARGARDGGLAAFLVGLVSSVLSAIFSYCYYAFINPAFSEIIFQDSAAKLEASGISGDRLDKIEAMNRTFMTPAWETIFGFGASLVFALLIALILAAFLKRPAPPELQS